MFSLTYVRINCPFRSPETELFPPAFQFTKVICEMSKPTLFSFFQYEIESGNLVLIIYAEDCKQKTNSPNR